ncbi:MAG: hypothetical protein ACNA7W_21210 [Pseudomonadales bacterium]
MSSTHNDSSTLSEQKRRRWHTQREFYRRNRPTLLVILVVNVSAWFIGLALAGGPGMVVGVLVGAMAYVLLPAAQAKIRGR